MAEKKIICIVQFNLCHYRLSYKKRDMFNLNLFFFLEHRPLIKFVFTPPGMWSNHNLWYTSGRYHGICCNNCNIELSLFQGIISAFLFIVWNVFDGLSRWQMAWMSTIHLILTNQPQKCRPHFIRSKFRICSSGLDGVSRLTGEASKGGAAAKLVKPTKPGQLRIRLPRAPDEVDSVKMSSIYECLGLEYYDSPTSTVAHCDSNWIEAAICGWSNGSSRQLLKGLKDQYCLIVPRCGSSSKVSWIYYIDMRSP